MPAPPLFGSGAGFPATPGGFAVNEFRQRWQVLSSAPHRMFFASGFAWLLGGSAWWTLVLAGRAAGIAGLEPPQPALLLHGAAMLYLGFTPFMYGFLLTVFPRWMPAPQAGRGATLLAFGLLNAGMLMFFAGLSGIPALLVTGWLLACAALAVVIAILLHILLRARERAWHAFTVLAGLLAGLLGMLLFAIALARGDYAAWPLVRSIGLWGFLLTVYFSVCHRMIPFFSSRVVTAYQVWRPDWILGLFVVLTSCRALLELAPGRGALATVPLALVAMLCTWRWWPRQRADEKLLDVLHISFAWLAVGLALAALSDLAAAFGWPVVLGRAPLHIIGIGFLGGMLMAMVTRVTLGHSGRPLAMDSLNWRLFLLIQSATVLRLAAELLPGVAAALSLAAALAWLFALLAWALRHLPIYLRPRSDGAPG